MTALLWMLLTVPPVTAAIVLLVGHRSEATTKGIAVAGAALQMALSVVVAVPRLGSAEPVAVVLARTGVTAPPIDLAVLVDDLSAVMLLLSGTVAFLVQVYSLAYLEHDPRYPSYAALVLVFSGAMTAVVVADDLWLLLVGWEVMGICSYFLISHHWEQPVARAGAVKAFLVTRTADLGLLLGILLLGLELGSYRVSEMTTADLTGVDVALPALLLLVAALGKSAQVPFHTWLPDAMPGPTPISALIHAATMVAAGVFLVARLDDLFAEAAWVRDLQGVVAAVTMVLAAVYALRTDDLKRVLAWSTVSQLAYMHGAVAVGAWQAGILHLLAHGAFKALLFLSAGAVVHAVGGATSMREMGGLRPQLPDTFVTMTAGFAALAGLVPLVGFFTKDAVVHDVGEAALDGGATAWMPWLLLVAMVATTALTVGYCLRAWLLTFFGEPPAVAATEAPLPMRTVLYLLTLPTVAGGLLVADPGLLLAGEAGAFHVEVALAMTVVVVAAGAGAMALWRAGRLGLTGSDGAEGTEGIWRAAAGVRRHGTEVAFDRGLVRPVRRLADMTVAGDRDVIDAYVRVLEGSARRLGGTLRAGQSGNVQSYLTVVLVGGVVVAAAAGLLR